MNVGTPFYVIAKHMHEMVSHQLFDCIHTLPNFTMLMLLQQPEN